MLALEFDRSRGNFGGSLGRVLVDVVLGGEGSGDLGKSFPVRPRTRDGVGEGVNRSITFVVVVEGGTRVFD